MSTATLPTPSAADPDTGPRLLTAADLASLPTLLPSGEVRYELLDGVLVVMPPSNDFHARRQARIIRYLGSDAEDLGLGETRGEVGILLRRNPDRVVGADAAFILTRSLPVRRTPEDYLETIPEIVVEIRSPSNRRGAVAAKITEYHDAGVLVVWVFDDRTRTVAAHRPDGSVQVFREADTLICPDLLPGFAVPVRNLFPQPIA